MARHNALTQFYLRAGGVYGFASAFERCGVTSSSEIMVGTARFAGHALRDSPPPRYTRDPSKWLDSAIQSRVPNLIASWQTEDLRKAFERARQVVAVDWEEQHAELLNFRDGPKAYEWAAEKLRRKGFVLSFERLYDLTAGFLLSGVLARAVLSFDLNKGGGREANWLATVFYRYALRMVLDDPREVSLSVDYDPPAPGQSLDSQIEKEEVLHTLNEKLLKLPPNARFLVTAYFGLGTDEHTLAELADVSGQSVYLAKKRLMAALEILGSEVGAHRKPILRERTTKRDLGKSKRSPSDRV